MNNTIHHLASTGTPGGFECRTSTDCICVICIFFQRLAQRPVLPPSWLQCLKFSLTWGAGRCNPVSHTLLPSSSQRPKCTVTSSESEKSFLQYFLTDCRVYIWIITLQSSLFLRTSALWNFASTNIYHEQHDLHFGSSTEHKLTHLKSSQQNWWPEII